MERALRYELNRIKELSNKIYPTNAPKGQKPPYLVYLTRKRRLKDLNGHTNSIERYVLLNIFGESYSDMKTITESVENTLLTLIHKNIGTSKLYIEDLTIDEITETYENELDLYRGIIPLKIYYKEE